MTAVLSASECSLSARVGQVLFRNRSWLPIPFVAVPLIAAGDPTLLSWLWGLTFLLVGESIRTAGVAAAGSVTRRRSREVKRLVTYGVFAWCRNPLYVGNFLAWIAFTIISGVYWFLPVAIVIFAIEYSLIVRYEEGVLESIFGEEYLAYKRRTPRWLPRLPVVREEGVYDLSEALWSERSTIMQYAALIVAFYIKMRYF
jgi:protein-S-isoprenylcysteine O-methyltransferase Ste14